MTLRIISLLPLYLKEYYKNDPLFADSKIVTSAFNYETNGDLNKESFIEKIKFDQIPEDKLTSLKKVNTECFLKVAIENSDAVVKGSENLSEEILAHISSLNIPVLEFQPYDNFTEAYSNFYLNEVI